MKQKKLPCQRQGWIKFLLLSVFFYYTVLFGQKPCTIHNGIIFSWQMHSLSPCQCSSYFGQVPLYFSQFSHLTSVFVQGDLHCERRSISSSTVTNLFQSWVPGVTSLRMYSAPTMAAAYDRAVWLIVVITSEPPGCVYHGRKDLVRNIIMIRCNGFSLLSITTTITSFI